MIRRLGFSLAALAGLLPAVAGAQVPKYVNFQSVLRDDGGNLVEDGFVDLQIKILDQDKDVVYEETQPGVQVVRSAINVMIGEGIEPGSSPAAPTGGIPLNALDPANGNHSLQIQFGSNLPSDPMELGSVPYAMYAETALKIDFNISAGELPPILVTEDELAAAITAAETDDLTTSTVFGGDVSGSYNSIAVADDSHNHTGATISGLTTSDFSSANISQWTNNAGYVSSSTADSNYVNVSGDTMTGALNMGGNNVTNAGSVDGVDLNNVASALNPNGSIKGAGYSAIGLRVNTNLAHGTNVCQDGTGGTPNYLPTGFTTADCGTNVVFLPILRQYEGDGGGTERVRIFIDGSYILNVCADNRCNDGSDGKLENLATVLAIGTR